MSGAGAFWLIFGLCVVGFFVAAGVQGMKEAKVMETGTDAEKAALIAKRAAFEESRTRKAGSAAAYGVLRSQIVCQQCQERGHVRCKTIKNKKGISGGKATGALLTGGVSLLATGLSRKEISTEAHCSNCQSTWQF